MTDVIGHSPRAEDPARITQPWFHAGMAFFGVAFMTFGAFLIIEGTSTVGSTPSWGYYVVIPVLLLSGVLCLVGLVRFPYAALVSSEGLELRYFLRRERVARTTVLALELRGDAVTRTVWLVKRDGTERPLGMRNPRILREWDRLRP